MLLENKYFSVAESRRDDTSAVARLLLLPDCDVDRGHFPGNPVCPGACNIETIRECASLFTGKELRISSIKQCRLIALATPAGCQEMVLTMAVTPTDKGYMVKAQMADADKTYVEYAGEMIAE